MLVVVAWHAVLGMAFEDGVYGKWAEIPAALMPMAVPLFFIVAGYLAQLSSFTAKSSWQEYLRHKAITVALPFFAWNALYILFYKNLYGWDIFTWKSLWYLITGYFHLWFIFVLLQLFCVHKLVIHKLQGKGARNALMLAALVSVGWYTLSTVLLSVNGSDGHFFEWYLGKMFFGWSIFYFAGVYLATAPNVFEWLERHVPALALALGIAFVLNWMAISAEVATYGDLIRHYFLIQGLPYQILAPIFVLVSLKLVKNTNSPVFALLEKQGRNTLGIYLMHFGLVMLSVQYWLSHIVTMKPLGVIVITCIVWTLCTLTVWLCRKLLFHLAGVMLFAEKLDRN